MLKISSRQIAIDFTAICQGGVAILFLLLTTASSAQTTGSTTPLVIDPFGNRYGRLEGAVRVVSLSPSITETLIALGLQERLVGVTRYCDNPDRVAVVGGIVDFDLEKIVALKPDLVLASASGAIQNRFAQLKSLLGERLLAYPIESLENYYGLVDQLGFIFQLDSSKLKQEIIREVEAVRLASKKFKFKRLAMVVGCQPEIGVGRDTYLDEWIRLAGGVNVLDAATGYPPLSLERLLVATTERVIFVVPEAAKACEHFQKRLIAARPELTLVTLEANLYQRPGPRLGKAIRKLFETLHPTPRGRNKRG